MANEIDVACCKHSTENTFEAVVGKPEGKRQTEDLEAECIIPLK
jgi:hypothetical protein